jgi:hypothetical protein
MTATRPGAVLFLVVLAIPAQTLQEAENLWKQRKFGAESNNGNPGANEVFRDLVAKYPDDPRYRVRWGRMFWIMGRVTTSRTRLTFSVRPWPSRKTMPMRN